VPLILRLPGAERAGERSSAVTSVVDVFPTVLGALGLADTSELAAVDGIDLRARAREREGVYVESYFGIESFHWSQIAGFTDGRFKYVHSSRPELYDVVADPEETDDVLARAPGEAARLARAIEELARRPALAPALLADDYRGLSGEVERLGYAGAGEAPDLEPYPLADPDAPSPHERIAGFAAYKEAQGRLARGDSAEAVALLERVVAENPENSKARFSLGLALTALGRFEDAVAAFRPVVAAPGGERIPAELNLAVCLQNLGDAEGALAHYEHALSDTIGPPGAMELLIDLLEKLGRTEDAERERRRLAAARASGDTRGPR
jgi:tetratricopeptide (TPR) repeat protein